MSATPAAASSDVSYVSGSGGNIGGVAVGMGGAGSITSTVVPGTGGNGRVLILSYTIGNDAVKPDSVDRLIYQTFRIKIVLF